MTKKILIVVALAACTREYAAAHSTYAAAQRELALKDRTNMELGLLHAVYPSLQPILRDAFAFAVFPGGAHGYGVLYVDSLPIGPVAILDLQGRTYTEVLVLRDRRDVEQLEAGRLELVDAPIVFMQEGRDISTAGIPGTIALIEQRGGPQLGVSVAGQQIVYEPRG